MEELLYDIIQFTGTLFTAFTIGRALASIIPLDPRWVVLRFIVWATEWYLKPLRGFLPIVWRLDFSTLVAIFIIQLLTSLLSSLLAPHFVR